MMKSFSWWKIGLVIFVLAGGAWMVRYVTTPSPGQTVEDQGREHVTPEEVAKFSHNSNPPTSGPHLPTWVRAGIYNEPQSEGELIHSLEHGYIIIHYNCKVHFSSVIFSKVYAHEEEEEASAGADLRDPFIATGSAITNTNACKELQQQLSDLVKRRKLWKLIVVPRPQLDTTIAVTAWDHIDKFDQFDRERIERFIDYYRDHGPEKTME